MHNQRKQLVLRNKTYILELMPYQGLTFECRVCWEGDDVHLVTRRVPSAHDARFLAHRTAYELAGLRRGQESSVDKRCEEECEEGWTS